MHAGQLATRAEVVEHYDRAPQAPAGHTEFRPLRDSRKDRAQLEAYLWTLDAPVEAEPWLLQPLRDINSQEGER